MSDQSTVEKAQIMKMDREGSNELETYPVKFNPKELTFSKQNQWKTGLTPKSNVPDFEFGGGGAATLKLQLFFDTYSEGANVDVRKKYTDKIYALMFVDESLKDPKNKKGRPPRVRFQWGRIGFNGVITSISQRFTLFTPSGVPVRAVLDVTFQQAKDDLFYPSQNPTSGGLGTERAWTVRAGDSLQSIAYRQLGDTTRWRAIANANKLTRVRDLQPGQVLLIPNL